MRRILLLAVLLMIVAFPAHADEGYVLVEPDAETFLRAVPQVVDGCGYKISFNEVYPWDLCRYLVETIEERYLDDFGDLPYDVLAGAYNTLNLGLSYDVPGSPYLWFEPMLMAWLRDYQIDLAQEDHIVVAHTDFDVEPRDFNADGVDEYLLKSGEFGEYRMILLLAQLEDCYRLVETGLPTHEGGPYWLYSTSMLRDIAFDDFNADGLPEWLLTFDGASYAGTYSGSMYLLAWRDGQLVSVVDDALDYIPFFNTNAAALADEAIQDGFVFLNPDDDPALELQRIAVETDNWGCPETHTTVFDWDAEVDSYIHQPFSIHRAETMNCVIQDAEEALADLDFAGAGHLYHYASTLPVSDSHEGGSVFEAELRQWVQLRLVQAKLLNREVDVAASLLDDLAGQVWESEMLQNLYDILNSHRRTLLDETCMALYDYFEPVISDAYDYGAFQEMIGTHLVIGANRKYSGDYMGIASPAEASLAGCNMPAIVDMALEDGLYGESSPVEQLAARGFLLREAIQTDFNLDGLQDWVIWHQSNVPAVILMGQGEGQSFAILRENITAPDAYTTVEMMLLPDGAGTALIEFTMQDSGSHNCGVGTTHLGNITLWQYADEGFHYQDMSWCDDLATVDEIFIRQGDQDLMLKWAGDDAPLAYIWDRDAQRYLPPESETSAVTTPEQTNAEQYALQNETDTLVYYQHLAEQASEVVELDAVIALIDAGIHAPYVDNPEVLRYWKAEILRQADRPDEALAEYVAIYEAAPESPWGKLAALHFESAG